MKNKIVILTFLLCGIFTITNAQERAPKQQKQGYAIGDKAMDFKLKNVDDKLYSLADIKKAKGYIVVFTSNVCPFALLYEDRIIELHKDMAAKGYPVIAINSNDASMEEGDSFDNMKLRAKEKNFPFLYLEDKKQTVYPNYGATKTPHVFLLDKNFIVQYIGAIDDSPHDATTVKTKYVRDAIAALEKGEAPNPNQTKAIGCPIKSKNGGGHAGKGGRKGPPSPDKILEMMDKNNDQKVSLEEAHGPLKGDFSSLDKDKDGFLTKEELTQIKKRKH